MSIVKFIFDFFIERICKYLLRKYCHLHTYICTYDVIFIIRWLAIILFINSCLRTIIPAYVCENVMKFKWIFVKIRRFTRLCNASFKLRNSINYSITSKMRIRRWPKWTGFYDLGAKHCHVRWEERVQTNQKTFSINVHLIVFLFRIRNSIKSNIQCFYIQIIIMQSRLIIRNRCTLIQLLSLIEISPRFI